jgi:rubrerythrin
MDRDKLFDIFKIAIDMEHEAHEFYTKAAETTSDPEVKMLFEEFAAAELVHKQKLKEKYSLMREDVQE